MRSAHIIKVAFLVLAYALSSAVAASDMLDDEQRLDAEITAWKPGVEVPHRLLRYPEGDVPPMADCAFGVVSAMHVIAEVKNDALLEALMFDSRAESSSLYAAITELVRRKGLAWFSDRIAAESNVRWEIDALRQALRFPFSRMNVAHISTDSMPRSRAIEALVSLKKQLDAGKTWKEAYGDVADANPDVERRKREGAKFATLVGYEFSGWISSSGFSFSGLGINDTLPRAHLGRVVGSSYGGFILESSERTYLYYVHETWSPDA